MNKYAVIKSDSFTIKRNNVLTYATTCVKLKTIMLKGGSDVNKIGSIQLASPPTNHNMAYIHEHKSPCGNFGDQIKGCKTPVEPKTKECCF